jgi:alkanesulfonate monooxygenase SsuD/methylene tetrahydromethanopterin reductase-like flavin-dependent oxidoreductase (luciferase family)
MRPATSIMVDAYVEAGKKAGRRTRRSDIRASRFVYISETTEKAKEELRPTVTPSLERRNKQYPHHFAFHLPGVFGGRRPLTPSPLPVGGEGVGISRLNCCASLRLAPGGERPRGTSG